MVNWILQGVDRQHGFHVQRNDATSVGRNNQGGLPFVTEVLHPDRVFG